ncbi:hypothetical protein RUND412_000057 [Rhizina undulata]
MVRMRKSTKAASSDITKSTASTAEAVPLVLSATGASNLPKSQPHATADPGPRPEPESAKNPSDLFPPLSESAARRQKRVKKPKPPPSSFPSKPYMRGARDKSPTSILTAAWNSSDDERLLNLKASGKSWAEMMTVFQGKSSNACRKRHARLVANKRLVWNEDMERELAAEFVNAKVGLWRALGSNLGLEWQQVEKKCVEMGLQTLLEKGRKVNQPKLADIRLPNAAAAPAVPESESAPVQDNPSIQENASNEQSQAILPAQTSVPYEPLTTPPRLNHSAAAQSSSQSSSPTPPPFLTTFLPLSAPLLPPALLPLAPGLAMRRKTIIPTQNLTSSATLGPSPTFAAINNDKKRDKIIHEGWEGKGNIDTLFSGPIKLDGFEIKSESKVVEILGEVVESKQAVVGIKRIREETDTKSVAADNKGHGQKRMKKEIFHGNPMKMASIGGGSYGNTDASPVAAGEQKERKNRSSGEDVKDVKIKDGDLCMNIRINFGYGLRCEANGLFEDRRNPGKCETADRRFY